MMYSRDKHLPLCFLKYIFLIIPFVVNGYSGPVEGSSFVLKLRIRRSGGLGSTRTCSCFMSASTFLALLPPAMLSSSSRDCVSWQCHFPI